MHAEADTTYGKLGVKVWIYRGEVLPTSEEENNNVTTKTCKISSSTSS